MLVIVHAYLDNTESLLGNETESTGNIPTGTVCALHCFMCAHQCLLIHVALII